MNEIKMTHFEFLLPKVILLDHYDCLKETIFLMIWKNELIKEFEKQLEGTTNAPSKIKYMDI